jgi:hypothetical protein
MSTDRPANAWGCDPSEVWHQDEWCFALRKYTQSPDGRGYPARQLTESDVAERRPCELCYGKGPGAGPGKTKPRGGPPPAPGSGIEEFLRGRRKKAGS